MDFRRGVLLNGRETQQGLVTAGPPWTPWAESQPTATIWTVPQGLLSLKGVSCAIRLGVGGWYGMPIDLALSFELLVGRKVGDPGGNALREPARWEFSC